MLVLLPSCSARVDDVGNYLERNLDKDYKLEGTSDGLPASVARVVPEKVSDMGVEKFGLSRYQ